MYVKNVNFDSVDPGGTYARKAIWAPRAARAGRATQIWPSGSVR